MTHHTPTTPAPVPDAPAHPASPQRRITLTSFGHLHGAPPTAELTVDVRRWLHDPAAAQNILDLDGRDPRVQHVVCQTPGAVPAIRHIARFVNDYPTDRDCTIAIGCAGGRHRSVAITLLTAGLLMMHGHPVHIEHRDVHFPRVLHSTQVATEVSTPAASSTPDASRTEPTCTFCRILAGREPATIVRRWPHAIAIVPLDPVVTGHLLVIPTQHIPDLTANHHVAGTTMQAAAELATAYQHCNVITSRGKHATQTIHHLHLHVVPRNATDRLTLPWTHTA